jgi:hypothetical protein
MRAERRDRARNLVGIAGSAQDSEHTRREYRREERLHIDSQHDRATDVRLREADDRPTRAEAVRRFMRWNIREDPVEDPPLDYAKSPLRSLDEASPARLLRQPGVPVVSCLRIALTRDPAAVGQHGERVEVETDPGRQLSRGRECWNIPTRLRHLR